MACRRLENVQVLDGRTRTSTLPQMSPHGDGRRSSVNTATQFKNNMQHNRGRARNNRPHAHATLLPHMHRVDDNASDRNGRCAIEQKACHISGCASSAAIVEEGPTVSPALPFQCERLLCSVQLKSVQRPFRSQSPKRVGSGITPPFVGPPHSCVDGSSIGTCKAMGGCTQCHGKVSFKEVR